MQYLRLFAVMYVSVFVFGMNVGIQGIVNHVAERGVFSDECAADESLPCEKQEKRIATVINVMLSITNMVSLPNGFLIDAIGGEIVTIISLLTWIIATCVAGLSPASGIVWSVALCSIGWANSAAFMSFSTLHLRVACENDKGVFAFWSTVSMACRAIGALMAIPMSYFLGIHQVDFWLLYSIWGLAVGVPVTLIFIYIYVQDRRKKKKLEANTDANIQGDVTVQTAEKQTKMQKARADFKAAFFSLPFWTLTFRLTVLVTFGSIFIANLGALARYHGATKETLAAVRQHFTFILGGLGATNPIPGFIIKKTNTHRGIGIVSCISILFVVAWICGCILEKGEFNWLFYMAFVTFALWRYWAYGVCSLYVPAIFPTRQAGFGLIFGSSGAVAGTVSVAIGGYITHIIENDPINVTPKVIALFGVLAICADIFTIHSMYTLHREEQETISSPPQQNSPLLPGPLAPSNKSLPRPPITTDSGRCL